MEFGIFSQMHVPNDEDEHSRFLRTVDVSVAVDSLGFKYDWAPEHHFLEEYSHQPAPECYLSFVAARTRKIHVGHAIVNLTAAVNHPARVAERIATVDHLTEGRIEFGTGRGSSSTEWAGFAIPSAAETKPMWRESLEQIPRMWLDAPYTFEGKYFRMPNARNVLPKPYSKPHPPIWVACSSPNTFVEAGELGLGCLCFTLGTADMIAPFVKAYKEAIKRCTKPLGAYVNDNIAVTSNMFCLPDGEEARALYCTSRAEHYQELVFTWLDSIPRPPGLPKEGPLRIPPPTPEQIQEGMKVAEVVRKYEAIGVDQLIYAPLCSSTKQKDVLRSLETFSKHVLPRFDKDPVHRTTRQREAALAAQAA